MATINDARTAGPAGRPGVEGNGIPGLTRSSRTVPRWAVISAGLSPAVLTGGWLIADALQPASYSPLRKTVSVLAGRAGADRWVMTGALLLVGGCYLLTAAGLTSVRLHARILLVIAGFSSIGIAASPEPVAGSTPQHVAWTVLGEITIAVWPAFTARRAVQRPLILSRPGTAAVTVAFVALLAWLTIETRGGGALGLAERLTSSAQTTWPFIVAVALRRTGPRPPQPEQARSRPEEPEEPEEPDAQAITLDARSARGPQAHASGAEQPDSPPAGLDVRHPRHRAPAGAHGWPNRRSASHCKEKVYGPLP